MKTETPKLIGKDKMKNSPILASQTQIRGSFSESYPMGGNSRTTRRADIPGQSQMVLTGYPEPVRLGKTYLFTGKPYAVGLLNDCRARLDPAFKIRREIISRLHDIRRTIYTTPPSVSISTTATLSPILDV